mmetsp:Transcript_17310/g.25869  ORF Transcript_17310/g.25869 Transcript_17310/m.25869 type:complete len:278 (+) Transcript_17310:86-919(+)
MFKPFTLLNRLQSESKKKGYASLCRFNFSNKSSSSSHNNSRDGDHDHGHQNSTNTNTNTNEGGGGGDQSSSFATEQTWSEEWKCLGLGARLPRSPDVQLTNLLFVQTGFGIDQHGNRKADGATKAAVRAVRNAIEFNSIPGVIEAVPGGRNEMLIQVLLGVPPEKDHNNHVYGEQDADSDADAGDTALMGHQPMLMPRPMHVDLSNVAKVFPYGRLLPIQVVVGGLSFPTGRIVTELGDEDDYAICVAASISIGYDSGERSGSVTHHHKTYDTRDGY